MALRRHVGLLLAVAYLADSYSALAAEETPPQLSGLQVILSAAEAKPGNDGGPCSDAMLRAEPHSGPAPKAEELELVTSLLATPAPSVRLFLAEGTWTISLSSDSCWAAAETIQVPGTKVVDLEVRTLGRVEFLARQRPGDEMLGGLRVKFFFSETPAEADQNRTWLPDGAADCAATGQEQRFSCPIPEGILDLMLSSPGVASKYYWSVSVAAAKSTRLSPWLVRPGASLSGWVSDETDGDLAQTSITLRRDSSGRAASREEHRRSSRTNLQVRPTKKGFFQLAGLEAGAFTIEASRGSASAGPFRVLLAAGRETLMKSLLVLEEPLPLDIAVVPAPGPNGKGWRLELAPMSRAPGRYEESRTVLSDPETGRAQFKGVRPGRFALWLKDPEGGTWWFDQIEVLRDYASILIALDLVEVCGIVSLGDDPLRAQLHFGGERGTVRRSVDANEDGEFSLLVPRDGAWKVDIVSNDPPVKRRLQKVRIRHNPTKGCAPVEIVLPDTVVRGVVLDEDENPVHPALVQVAPISADTLEPLAQVTTLSEDGVFELFGYPEGSVMLSAHVPTRSSDQELVTLDEDLDPPLVRLILKEHVLVRGQVLGPSGGPVPGAKIFARGVDGVIAITNHTTTKIDGTFELEISPRSADAILSVMAPGYSFKTGLYRGIDTRAVTIGVSSSGGLLELEMPKVSFQISDSARPVLFNEAGLSTDLWVLRQWAAINGAASSLEEAMLVLPSLEPGTYTACMVPTSQGLALPPGAVPTEGCTSTFVGAGGSQRLVLADDPAPRRRMD